MNLLSWNLALRASVLLRGDQNSSGAGDVALVHYCRDRCLTLVLPDDALLLRLVDKAPRCLHIISQSSLAQLCNESRGADTRRCFHCWTDFFFCFGFVLVPDAKQSGSFSALSKPLEKIGSLDNLPRVTITAVDGRQVLRYSPETRRRCWYIAKATKSSTLVGKRFFTRPRNARIRVNPPNPPGSSHVNSDGGQDGDVNCCDTLVVCEEGPSVVSNSLRIFGDITPNHDAAVSAIAQDIVCCHSVLPTQHLMMTIDGLADEHMRLIAATAIAGRLQGDQSMFSRLYQMVCDALLLTSPVDDIMRQRQKGGAPLTDHTVRLVHGIRRARNRALNSGDAILGLEQRLSPLTANEAAALFGNRLVGCVRKIDEIAAGSSCCRAQTTSRCGLDQLWSWRDIVHTVIRELASPLPRRQAQNSPAVGKQHNDIAADDLVPALVYCILSSSISAEAVTAMMFHMQHAVRQESFAKRYSELLLDRICVDTFLDCDKLPNSVTDCLANGMFHEEEDYLVVTLEVCLEYIASL